MSQPHRDNVLIVHWHDLGRYLGAYGYPGRVQPTAGPTRRRGHPLHPRARHRAAVLAVAGLAVHRPLSAQQRSGRAGSPRLGVPRRRPHAARTSCPNRLAYSTFRHAARDLVPGQARLRRVRRVQLLLRVRRRAGQRLARRPAARAVPADRGLLRDPPARTRATATSPPTPTPSTCPTICPTPPDVRQDLAEFYGSIAVADAAVGQLLDTLADTGLDRTTWVVFMTDHGPALPRAKSTLYDAGTGIAIIVRPPTRLASSRLSTTTCSAAWTWCRRCWSCSASRARRCRRISHAAQSARTASAVRPGARPRSTRRRPITTPSIRSGRSERRSTATSRTTRTARCSTCPGHRRQRVRPGGRAVHRRPAPGARALRPAKPTPPKATICSAPASDEAERSPKISRCCSTIGGRRPTTSFPRISREPGSRRATPKPICTINGPQLTSRSAIAAERGIEDEVRTPQ